MSDEVAKNPRRVRKEKLKVKIERLLNEYKNVLICKVDNVGSSQMQKVRIALRGKAEFLMGKNTLIRKVIREQTEQNKNLEYLMPLIVGNVGLVLTNADLKEVRDIIQLNKVPAAAKSGTSAPMDVFVPPGPTGLDPGQTAFFQALSIPTKINRGAIEIANIVHLIKKGDRVSASAVALLTKLNIKPFFYSVVVDSVYENGSTYASEILDMSSDDLLAKFFAGVRKVAALSLAIGYPTVASLPHSLSNGFRKLLAISLATEYEIKEAKMFTAAAAAGPAVAAGAATAAPAAAAAAVEEEPEEEEADMGFSLFD